MNNYEIMESMYTDPILKNHLKMCEKVRKDINKVFEYINSHDLKPIEIWFIGFQMWWNDNERTAII